MGNKWPNGARCVVAFTVDFDGTGNEMGQKVAAAGQRSAGGYSARRGIPRMIEIFERHGIPATFFVPGYDAETNPDTVKAIIAAGHEVAAHGYVHESFDVPEDEEEELLRKSHQILIDTAGTAPLGWRSPGGKKSSITLKVLRELGCIYDSSDKDFDRPYPAIVEGKQSDAMVELPNNTSSLDDAPYYTGGAATPMEMLALWKDEFDSIYNDNGYYILTYHPRSGFGSGIPSRARVIDRLIAYIKTHPDVHFTRMDELAKWCLKPANGFMDRKTWIGGTRMSFWPEGYHAAATVTVNFDGESVEQRQLPDQTLWGRFSYGRYGAQIGVYRILEALARYDVKATFFIPGFDADRYPAAMEAIASAGHEVAGRGYACEDFSALTGSAQEAVLQRGEDTFKRVFGAKPAGFRAPEGQMSNETRAILASRSYRYDSTYCDDDIPYVVADGSGNRLAELPLFHTSAVDRHYYQAWRQPEVVREAFREELSAMYEVGGLFNLALHPRGDYGSGRGVRIRVVEDILQTIRETPRLWVATCGEVASYTLESATEDARAA